MPPKRTPDPIVSHTNVQVIDCFVKFKKKIVFQCGIVIVADVGPSSSKQNAKGLTQAAKIKECLLHLIRQRVSWLLYCF